MAIKFKNYNLYLVGFSRDINGNPTIKLKFHNQSRGFSIQLNENSLKNSNLTRKSVDNRFNFFIISDENLSIIETEVVNYLENFGSKNQKILLRINKV